MWNKKSKASVDPSCIGNVLVEMGFASKSDVQDTLKELDSGRDKMLGEYLVRKNIITEDQLELAQIKQQMLLGKSSTKLVARALAIAKSRNKKVLDSMDQLQQATLSRVAR